MNEYKIRIKRDGVWRFLELTPGQKVKYNVLVNKIGDPTKREISHSNTYTLPNTRKNQNALGLNKFNSSQLVSSLNKKYECEIIIRERVEQAGFLVINRTEKNDIKVNIIDRALDLLDRWGAINLRQMLNDSTLVSNLPTDYQTAVQEMKDYSIGDGTTVLPSLSEVGTRGFPYALFPNTLNAIGDDFNKLENGDRVPFDNINPYQTRPIWNVKAFFDSICYAFGYSPIYADAVDRVSLERNYMVAEGGGDNVDPSTLTETYTVESFFGYMKRILQEFIDQSLMIAQTLWFYEYDLSEAKALTPTEIEALGNNTWVSPPGLIGNTASYADYSGTKCIYVPDVSNGYSGTLNINGRVSKEKHTDSEIRLKPFGVYSRVGGGDVIHKEVTATISNGENYTNSTDWSTFTAILTSALGEDIVFNAVVDKTDFETLPTDGDTFLGIIISVEFYYQQSNYNLNPEFTPANLYENDNSIETYLPDDVKEIVYNDYLEYQLNTVPNLTREAPTEKTIKELLSLNLKQQGLLTNINDNTKEVTFFNYDTIKNKIVSNDAYNWSNYLLRWEGLERDTDFGEKYAKINRISLEEPYRGNAYDYIMPNQGTDSKYKDFIESPVEGIKDVSKVQLVNPNNISYFEYTNEGLGLVYSNSIISGLTQTRADGTTATGTIDVPLVQNINYSNIPSGVRSWYQIIDNGLRVKGLFLIPKSVINTLDLTKPIYIDEVRGYLIIEEIKEYVDGQTPVEVVFLLPN